jgi:hypothetical protein
MSKDLIDLDNDNALRRLDEMNSSNISDIRCGDKTMGAERKKNSIKSEFFYQKQKKEASLFEVNEEYTD